MPVEIIGDGEGGTCIKVYGPGFACLMSHSMYDTLKSKMANPDDPIHRPIDHPLFAGVVYTGFGGVNIVTKPWSVGEPYPTGTPWLMPDGRHVGAQRYPPPRIRTAIATAAILAHHIGENDHG